MVLKQHENNKVEHLSKIFDNHGSTIRTTSQRLNWSAYSEVQDKNKRP